MDKKIAEELLNAIVGTKNFIVEQAPDVAQQLLAYHLVTNSIGAVLVLLFTVVFAHLVRWYYKAESAEGVLVMAIAFTVSVCFLIECLTSLAKVILAPKIFLIEYLGGLLK